MDVILMYILRVYHISVSFWQRMLNELNQKEHLISLFRFKMPISQSPRPHPCTLAPLTLHGHIYGKFTGDCEIFKKSCKSAVNMPIKGKGLMNALSFSTWYTGHKILVTLPERDVQDHSTQRLLFLYSCVVSSLKLLTLKYFDIVVKGHGMDVPKMFFSRKFQRYK